VTYYITGKLSFSKTGSFIFHICIYRSVWRDSNGWSAHSTKETLHP